MATQSVRFATVVGVAPSTTTMRLGDACSADQACGMSPVVAIARRSQGLPGILPAPQMGPSLPPPLPEPPPPPVRSTKRYSMPYASLEDLRSANPGLGIVNESDAWLTGRPYGLPGTATVQLLKRQGGYNSPDGYHYDARMFGGLGDADATLQLILAQQQAQAASLKRIAFWQTVAGGLTVAGIAAGITLAVINWDR